MVNKNFPAPSVPTLRAAGIYDGEVLSRATREQRWLVTFDRDYGELIFARGYPSPPAVILLRVIAYRPDAPVQWVMQLAQDTAACLGKFTVFDGGTIRSRPLLRPVGDGNN